MGVGLASVRSRAGPLGSVGAYRYLVVMLSALLPGVREFRTPMVTGLLWAACLWLLVGVPVAESRATVDFVAGFDLDRLPTTA